MKAFQGGAHISCKPNSWPPWAHSNSGWMVVGEWWGWWVLGWEWGRGGQDASIVFAYYGAGSHCRFCPLCKRKNKRERRRNKKQERTARREVKQEVQERWSGWMLSVCGFFGDNEERLRAKGLFDLSDLPHRKKFKIPRAVFLTRYLSFA